MIREANTDDLKQIIDITVRSRQSIYANVMPASIWSDKPYEDWYKSFSAIIDGTTHIEKAKLFVVDDNNNIHGFGVAGYLDENYRDKLSLHWIWEIFLDPNQKGHGYGKMLMHEMIAFFMKDGAKEFGLSVGKTNTHARGFYNKIGGEVIKTFDENNVHGHIVPAYIYQWDNLSEALELTRYDD